MATSCDYDSRCPMPFDSDPEIRHRSVDSSSIVLTSHSSLFEQARRQIVGERAGRSASDVIGPAGSNHFGDPVDRAHDREADHLRDRRAEEALIDALLDDLAQAVIEAIALGDDPLQQRRRQRLQVERQRRALQLVEHHVDERENRACAASRPAATSRPAPRPSAPAARRASSRGRRRESLPCCWK